MLPVVAVQIDPGAGTPALERQLLSACSAGLSRARCVSSREVGPGMPRGIAVVSWDVVSGGAAADGAAADGAAPDGAPPPAAAHASIEVGLANGDEPLWITRQLGFMPADPEVERWRAVGFTIALMVDDPRFWPPEPPEATDAAAPPPAPDQGASPPLEAAPFVAELRGVSGKGLVSGAWRWGAELRLTVPIGGVFFVTGGVDYALARDTSLDARWFDVGAGIGVDAGRVLAELAARLRLELLAENVGVTVRRDQLADRASAWVPGVSLGTDLHWPVGESWLLSARADAFWLDGSTAIVSAGQRLGASAGAGVKLGLGAGYRF